MEAIEEAKPIMNGEITAGSFTAAIPTDMVGSVVSAPVYDDIDKKRKREDEGAEAIDEKKGFAGLNPEALAVPPPAPRIPQPVLPPKPHPFEHPSLWTPIDVTVCRCRRSAVKVRPTRHLDVLLSCSDGDMPEMRRHRGTAFVFRDEVRTRIAAPSQSKEQQQAALEARMKQQAARQAAEQARAAQAAASRTHSYSTRVRNATKNFKELYPDLLADDDDEADEDEKLDKDDESEEESSSEEEEEDSEDSEVGRARRARKPAVHHHRPSHQVHHHQQQQHPQQRGHAGQTGAQFQQQRMQRGGDPAYGGYPAGGAGAANTMQQQAAVLQRNAQLQQFMAMLSPQEQQMVMNIPPQQRPQAVVALVQQKQAQNARQQQAQQQQRFGGAAGGLDSIGFVPSGGAGAMYNNNMRSGAPQQQQGLGLQLPGMLGQQQQPPPQQHSINPFTGGGTNPQYRF
ncbi:hypothetical protein CEUSTIGMA_g9898.t1 [Chlamydomonas eustigma]|uniref:Uncharacterized protein n=1 Tax=Chlamydomonas eustigma TaxID=1157962 RepID=A0A250XHB5_9CHLO|nr:hypothetical protein CEUSTIGMA_g9898.t1 [Chlamydomonas eustigma]|eukprot:GAX82471.1 hypothetical protein CEUSTIGMA_g9898.t1 [Chlamydomonas eustigma]